MTAHERSTAIARFELELSSTYGQMAERCAELEQRLLALGVEPAARYRAQLVYEELVGNVLRYGGAPAGGIQLRLEVVVERERLVLVILDDGLPFDPTAEPDPPNARSVAEARVGGRGIAMVRRVARRFVYRREGRRNRVELEITRDAS
ncbi:MAG: ATP-binding protein [Planctomycetes bacterium]|nr:ATP-binding protein [Planctomycetota bacterium]